MKFAIDKYKIDAYKLYSKFDKSKKQQLGVSDFEEMIKRVDPSLNLQDIKTTFKKFDAHNKGYISYQEFELILNNMKWFKRGGV